MPEQPQNYQPTYINNPGRTRSFAQGQPVYIVRAKSVLVSYLLFFFLWWLGAHKFYLRQPIMGVIYLVGAFFAGALTGLIPFIGWLSWIPLVILGIWDLFTIPLRVGYLNALATRRFQ